MAERDGRSKVPRAKVDQSPAGHAYDGSLDRDARDGATAPQPSAEGGQAGETQDTQEGASFRHAREGMRAWLHATFPGHENAFIWGCIGFVVALLLFAIGFWRTLVVVLLVVVGVAFGQVLDGDPKIINTVRGLFSGDNGR